TLFILALRSIAVRVTTRRRRGFGRLVRRVVRHAGRSEERQGKPDVNERAARRPSSTMAMRFQVVSLEGLLIGYRVLRRLTTGPRRPTLTHAVWKFGRAAAPHLPCQGAPEKRPTRVGGSLPSRVGGKNSCSGVDTRAAQLRASWW